MKPADYRRAERLAPAIAAWMWPHGEVARADRGVDTDLGRGLRLGGDQQRGWSAAFASRRSIVRGQPPDTVDGWAGWLAAYIGGG